MEADGSAAPAARLKIGGAWSGILEVRMDTWTVPMLRAEVARRSSGGDRSCINLTCAGKLLMDGDGAASLRQLGIKNNVKMLATRVSADRVKSLDAEASVVNAKEAAEAERSNKLARIREATKALYQKHSDGSIPLEDFNIELEDQSGQAVPFGSESDKRAVMMGLMLHTNSKSLMNRQNYKDALDVFTMAEEAFSLCDPKFIECYFISRAKLSQRRKRVEAGSSLTAGDIEEIISMGNERAEVIDALNNVHTKKDLLRVLGGMATGNNDQQAGSNPPTHDQASSSGAAANSQEDNHMDGEVHSNDGRRDTIIENELANKLTGDPLADYDIEVAKEGEAILEYLSLLESTTSAS